MMMMIMLAAKALRGPLAITQRVPSRGEHDSGERPQGSYWSVRCPRGGGLGDSKVSPGVGGSAALLPSEASVRVLCADWPPHPVQPRAWPRGSGCQPSGGGRRGVLGAGAGASPAGPCRAGPGAACRLPRRCCLTRVLSRPPSRPQVSGPSPARGQTALKSSRARTS